MGEQREIISQQDGVNLPSQGIANVNLLSSNHYFCQASLLEVTYVSSVPPSATTAYEYF